MGSIPILPANIKNKDMNRFKLVCIGIATLVAMLVILN